MTQERNKRRRLNYSDSLQVARFMENSIFESSHGLEFSPVKISTPKEVNEKTDTISKQYKQIPKFVFSEDGSKFLPCQYCSLAFSYRISLLKHMKTCENKIRESMNIVEVIELSQEDEEIMHIHKKLKSEEMLTDSKFKYKNKILTTQKNITDISESFSKDIPSSMRRTTSSKTSSKKKHDVLKPYSSKRFTNNTNDQNVTAMTTGLECVVCNGMFYDFSKLLNHYSDFHGDKGRILLNDDGIEVLKDLNRKSKKSNCPACDTRVSNAHFEKHLDLHRFANKFECSYCGICFRRKDYLARHIPRHEKQ